MTTILLRRATSVQWAERDLILSSGEQGYEIDTRKFKIGDGFSNWSQLDYYLPEKDLLAAMYQAISELTPGGGVSLEVFSLHVDSPTPHSVYDDGPSFLLLYQNAKV